MRSRFAVPIGIAAASLIAVLIFSTSGRFQNCVEEGYKNATQGTLPKQITNFFIIRKRCVGDYVQLYANGIIALFTVILAGSTIGLWGVTRIAANAAKTAAGALPNVERAYVFLAAEFQHSRKPNAIPGTGDIIEVRFALKNHGRTPAIMRQINAEIRVVDQLPTAFRQIASDMPQGLVISGGETTDFLTHRQLIPAADWAAFPRRTRLLLFLGVIHYTDVFGKPHETGFCLDWDGSGFGPSPTDTLNYYK